MYNDSDILVNVISDLKSFGNIGVRYNKLCWDQKCSRLLAHSRRKCDRGFSRVFVVVLLYASNRVLLKQDRQDDALYFTTLVGVPGARVIGVRTVCVQMARSNLNVSSNIRYGGEMETTLVIPHEDVDRWGAAAR